MIKAIEDRRSIRKYKPELLSRDIIEQIIISATLHLQQKTDNLGNLLPIREKKKTNWLM